jgi:hypothetical protein
MDDVGGRRVCSDQAAELLTVRECLRRSDRDAFPAGESTDGVEVREGDCFEGGGR